MNWLKRIKEAFHLSTQHEISMTNLKNYQGHYSEKLEKVESIQELCEKLLELNHVEHEGIIRILQDRADPFAIPYLKNAIELKPQLEYLAYDDYGGYYKKCLWALQAIGTSEAIQLIQELTLSECRELSEQAKYRIYRINGGI